MKSAKHQAGLTFISWIFVLAVVAFLGIFALKLAPVYIEYFSVRTVLQSFKTDATSYDSIGEVRSGLAKRFNMNNVREVSADDVVIEPIPGGYALQADYEVRVPYVANIDLVVSFSETGEVRGRSESAP